MEYIYNIIPERFVDSIGWTIVHSLWQSAVIAIILAIILLIFSKFTSKTRYYIASCALVVVLITSTITFFRYYNSYETTKQITSNTTFEENKSSEKEIITYNNSENVKERNQLLTLNSINFKEYFERNIPLIVVFWLLGILFLSLRFISGIAYVQRLKHYRTILPDKELVELMETLKKKVNVSKPVKILESAIAKTPMVVGAIKPVILIPVTSLTGLSEEQIRCIIAHELAHIKRNDYFINLIQSFIEILFFYHPATWWISSQIRSERENCCDDIAIQATGDSVTFVKTLADIEEKRLQSEILSVAFSGKGSLFKRVSRLINQPNMKSNFTEGFIASCAIFLGIFLIAINVYATDTNKLTAEEINPLNIEKEVVEQQRNDANNISVDDKTIYTSKRNQLSQLPQNVNYSNSNNSYNNSENLYGNNGIFPLANDSISDIQDSVLKKVEIAIEKSFEAIDQTQISKTIEEAFKNLNIEATVEKSIEDSNINETVTIDLDASNLGNIIAKSISIASAATTEAGKVIKEIRIDSIVSAAILAANVQEEIDKAIKEKGTSTSVTTSVSHSNSNSSSSSKTRSRSRNNSVSTTSSVSVTNPEFDSEHLEILKSGAKAWNKWRKNNKKIKPNLKGAYLKENNLSGYNLSNCNLSYSNLKEAILIDVNFKGADLSYSNMKEAEISDVNFENANLTKANLKEVTLKKESFKGANLTKANLKEAILIKVNFEKAKLIGTDLSQATLKDVKFRKATIKNTKFPEDYKLK